MIGESYRLGQQTIAIDSSGQERVCLLIPQNAVVTVIGGPLNGNRMVEVKWDRLTVMMFVEDLRVSGTLVFDYTGNS